MSYVSTKAIKVSVWGRDVGAVALDPTTNVYAFEYDPSWVANGADLAPLHMPRRSGVFEFPELSRETFYGLPAMLADALPDRFGNALVNAWMADEGVRPDAITSLDRLAYAGERAMGALTFAPSTGPDPHDVNIIQVADLVRAARATVAGSLDDAGVHDAIGQLITVGSTAGGLRAKAVIAYNPTTGQMRSGQLDAPDGFEQWLLKLDGVGDPAHSVEVGPTQPYCRVEYAYSLMASWAGVQMSESRLLPEGPRAHFLTRRFDRGPNNQRIHMQTLCALAHLDFGLARTHSYASYFITAHQLGLGTDALEQIFRRVAFNVMGINRDDHTKNVAFLLPEGGAWQLATAYDVTHSYWDGEWTSGHQMSVNGKFVGITLDDLRQLAERFEVPAIERALGEVTQAVAAWPDAAEQAGVDPTTTEKIARDIAELRPT